MTSSAHGRIEFDGEAFSVDAALIAEGLGIGTTLVQALMREGRITSRCERGLDQDAGRYRLTFFHEDRSVRLVIDESGEIVEREIDSDREARQRTLRRARRRLGAGARR